VTGVGDVAPTQVVKTATAARRTRILRITCSLRGVKGFNPGGASYT
jgi:hypothetical protein